MAVIISEFSKIRTKHQSLLKKQDNSKLPNSLVEDAKNLLESIRDAGKNIVIRDERQSLERYAEYWALYIYEHTNNYPDTTLIESEKPLSKGKRLEEREESTEKTLLNTLDREITLRLQNSLYNQIEILLNKLEDPSLVANPLDFYVKTGNRPESKLPRNTRLIDIYNRNDVDGKLLILGPPGSGKTTTLIQLAKKLIELVHSNPEHPIPVLLNLSSWTNKQSTSINEWIVNELNSNYGVSKDAGKNLLQKERIIPLLDGLDEVAATEQKLCVEKINDFLKPNNWQGKIVVTSRIDEYQQIGEPLKLNSSIILQRLSEEQIENYFKKVFDKENKDEFILDDIRKDKNLLDLIKIPLFLSILLKNLLGKGDHKINPENNKLFDSYIKSTFERFKLKEDEQLQIKNRLIWLAQMMAQDSKTDFLIEKMQPKWLITNEKKAYSGIILIQGLLVGLPLGLTYGIIFFFYLSYILPNSGFKIEQSVFFGLCAGIIIGPSAQFVLKVAEQPIETHGENKISWKKIQENVVSPDNRNKTIFMIVIVLLFCIIFLYILGNSTTESFKILLTACLIALYFGIVTFMSLAISNCLEDTGTVKESVVNQGIWNALSLCRIIAGSSIVLLFFLNIIYLIIIQDKNPLMLFIGLANAVVSGAVAALIHSSGKTCQQHFALRIVLTITKHTPWNYAKFLDYTTELGFLQKIGGRYKFIHKLLQDHFAEMDAK